MPRVTCTYTYMSPPPLRRIRSSRISSHCACVCGDGDADLAEAARQPVEVLAKAEHAAAEHRQHFVDAVAEQEGAVERRDARVAQLLVLAVQVADGQRLGHGQCIQSLTSSIMRLKKPASPTSSTGCSAYVPIVLSPRVTRSLPTSVRARQRREQRLGHVGGSAERAVLAARHDRVNVVRDAELHGVCRAFPDRQRQHRGVGVVELARLIEVEAVVQQRRARVFARARCSASPSRPTPAACRRASRTRPGSSRPIRCGRSSVRRPSDRARAGRCDSAA